MKMIVTVLVSVMIFVTCGSKNNEEVRNADGSWTITVKGRVAFPQTGKIMIQELKPDGSGKVDSIVLAKDNTFEKKITIASPSYYQLNFYNKQMLNIILYKNNIELNVDGNSQDGKREIKGSADHDIIDKVQKMMEEEQARPDIVALRAEFTKAAQANDAAKVSELQEKYLQLSKSGMDKIAAYLQTAPASLATIEILSQGNMLTRDEYPALYAVVVEKLKKEMPTSVFAKPFIDDFEKSKPTAIGQIAPEISMPDPSGKVVKLSSLRGKYVLVDFWAKWCGPCRRENPTVVRAYAKFKSKGFEVYGVSLDRDKADWLQAIKEDGLVWTQVSDLKYFQSQAAHDYNISAIPFSILVDPKGVIVAKNLRGAALDRKLTELLGK